MSEADNQGEARRTSGPSTQLVVALIVVATVCTVGLPIMLGDRWPLALAVGGAYVTGAASTAAALFLWARALLRGVGAALRKGIPAAQRPPGESRVQRAEAFLERYPNVTNAITSGVLPFAGGVLAALIGAASAIAIVLLS